MIKYLILLVSISVLTTNVVANDNMFMFSEKVIFKPNMNLIDKTYKEVESHIKNKGDEDLKLYLCSPIVSPRLYLDTESTIEIMNEYDKKLINDLKQLESAESEIMNEYDKEFINNLKQLE